MHDYNLVKDIGGVYNVVNHLTFEAPIMAETKQARVAPTVRLTGRIEQVRPIQTTEGRAFMHLVRLPAADAYSSPATVNIKSKDKMGQEGEEFSAECQIGGYGRSYQQIDEETGRKTTVRTADNTLTVI